MYAIGNRETPALITGLGHIHRAMLIGAIAKSGKCPLVLTGDEAEAAKLTEDLTAMGVEALLFPARDITFGVMRSSSREYEQQRLSVLGRLANGGADCVIASAEAAAQFTLPPDVLLDYTLDITADRPLPVSDLPAALVTAGYERVERVESAGQFAVRGGIIDMFPAAEANPVRLELWGDTVDTLSYFDRETQRRTEAVRAVSIPPAVELLCTDTAALAREIEALAASLRGKQTIAKEALLADAAAIRGGADAPLEKYTPLLYETPSTLFDYLPDSPVVACEWSRVTEQFRAAQWRMGEEIKALMEQGKLCRALEAHMLEEGAWLATLDKRPFVLTENFARTVKDVTLRTDLHIEARQLPPFSGSLELLSDDLRDLMARKAAAIVLAGPEEKTARVLAEDLAAAGLPALYAPHPDEPVKNRILVTTGGLSSGLEFPTAGVAVLTHGRSARAKKRRLMAKKDRGAPIGSLEELKKGDYVVHAAHGIGVYLGVQQVTMQGIIKDYIKIEFAKGDMLYVPVTQLDMVSKYIGTKDEVTVKLHRLGGVEWQKAKTRVRAAVKDIAKELIALYSKRMATKGYAFGEDGEWQYDFERHFPYEETDDQLRCADEIRLDMQRDIPMDRLLCGDVGFGKTEIALRAAFRCIAEGKQCVLLVPTTILAYQHYNTAVARFEGFPVEVEMLSRFRTPKQQKVILERVKNGQVDLLIGTHRLLSEDVKLKDLGLFIIDEEQRFGVAQKEKIKERFPTVDVLTLSATPIPRTLNMALSGIRDMSIIEEAPQDRHPVQTFVLEHDKRILTDAIQRELRRGGQVYYLHNRIDDIERVAAGWQMRLPEARIAVAHGRMSEEQMSDIWRQVLDREIDMLVCTTIIETGVDVPNVNTLIIENADRYGLSQLHQLRGRVGRSSRRAFAYLTFNPGKVLDEVAAKRLEAMREFTEFGAGFKIALRDMEIRGAGNLLGAQQHGHMEAVGYDMYLRLLADAVREQKGEAPAMSEEDCLIDLQVSAHIPESYIADSAGRLEAYRRIAGIRTHEDSLDVYDELIDRYGEPPEAVQGLVEVALLRNMAVAAGITEVKEQRDAILLYPKTLDMQKAMALSAVLKTRMMISAGAKPYYTVKIQKGLTALDTLREVLEIDTSAVGG
ncbi:MAG: transcription-repair coupling factor [Ruminococcaceae bacterium]|nr:transcription-repair coupling factor [Oscillospiraceae bacterium]